MKYIVDPQVYLDRQRRMLRARGKVDGRMAPDEIQRILAEAPLLDDQLVCGRRYRFRVLGGAPKMAHRHGVDEQGREWILNLPDVPDAEWLEREGEYLGRGTGMYAAAHLFHLGGGELAALADMDVLTIEELP